MLRSSRALVLLLALGAGCRGILGIEEPVDLVAAGSAGSGSAGRTGATGGSGATGGTAHGGEGGAGGETLGGAPGAGAGGRSTGELVAELSALKDPEGITSDRTRSPDPVADGAPYVSSTSAVADDGVPIKTTVSLQDLTASAVFGPQLLLNPSSFAIYPGSVLLGNSIHDGSYVEVEAGTKRKVTITYSGLVVEGGSTDDISTTLTPTYGTYRAVHDEITGQRFEGAGSAYELGTSEVSTDSAFESHFAESVSYPDRAVTDAVKDPLEYGQESPLYRYLIRFVQTYYTVDLELAPDTILFEEVEVDAFAGYRPVYVDSVTYGRAGHVTLQSPAARAAIEAGIEAIFEDPMLANEGDVSDDVRAVQESQGFHGTLLGSGAELTTLGELADYLSEEGFSASDTGSIVRYQLRFVDDGSPANTLFESSYVERATLREAGFFDVEADLVNIHYNWSDVPGEDPEITGRLTIRSGTTTHVLFDHTAQNAFVASAEGDKAVNEPSLRFQVPSLGDLLDFELTSVSDLDGLGGGDDDVYTNDLDSKIPLGAIVQEAESGSGMYTGHRILTAAGTEAADYVGFDVLLEATAIYPNE